jgi:hypothetical protein
MTIDAGEAAIRTVIAAAIAQHGEAGGRGLDALFAMRQAEVIVKALEHAGMRSGAGVDVRWQNLHAVSPLLGALTRCPSATSSGTASGQALAYVYSRDSEDEARQAKVLTKDEARRIAVNVARPPELVGKADDD